MDSPPNSPRMDKEVPRPMMGRILNLSLKIIYLLTGEDYGPQRKSWEEFADSGHSCAARRLRSPWSPVNELKILKLANMITELLTGEVSVRWHSVAVYFSMDEWEYLEGHKDLYKDIMENHQTITLLGCGNTVTLPQHVT
ncbi:gastrula zinc finger protein XlCGF66.1-like isoform X5 [Bufo bufo]|uniref:gastrula zinc finger protein XlCGF66.1-like isoform X5 n=1 Tax=Bufo bufo TaxID=8384 RepID=UPI001ABEA788|nr:gastrula zinc finger protein XlCGF66.1-like isoform X5 [Bufo bufo]